MLQEFIDGKIVYTIAKTDAIAKLDAAIAEGSVAEEAEAPSEEGSEGEEGEGEGEGTEGSGEEENPDNGYFYGIAEVPNLTESLPTKGLSVTNSVVVNAYSKERALAKEFAKFITYEKVDALYAMTNKMPVKVGVPYENPEITTLLVQYEHSVEVPKITDLSNYWIEMEIAFANIWRGNDVRSEIEAVDARIQAQLVTEE